MQDNIYLVTEIQEYKPMGIPRKVATLTNVVDVTNEKIILGNKKIFKLVKYNSFHIGDFVECE